MFHAFDIELAKKYGVLPAIMLGYIAHWVVYNRSLNQNRVNGKFWTYNSVAGMREQFPYMTVEQIRYSIRKLKEAGLVLIDKLSTDKHNNTNWYTLSDEGEMVCNICEKASMVFPNSACENSQTGLGNLPNVKDLLHYTITNNTLHTNNPPTPHSKKVEKAPVEKIEYAEYVTMKPTDYQKLVDEFGEATAKEFISILDNYKGAKGVVYKDDYRAIRNWVIKRWKEEHQEHSQPKTFAERDRENFLNTIKEMDDLYGSKH